MLLHLILCYQQRLHAKVRYPFSGSNTCCQGLVASGLRIMTSSCLDHDLKQSGTILFNAQSPPPITFPARVVHALIFELSYVKNEFLYPLNISSAEAFDVL